MSSVNDIIDEDRDDLKVDLRRVKSPPIQNFDSIVTKREVELE